MFENLQNYPNCILDQMIDEDNSEATEQEEIEDIRDDDDEQDAEIRNEAWRLADEFA